MSTTENALLSMLREDDVFTEKSLTYDLREGVIWNPAKTRLILLSTDLLSGVYKALYFETGPGWKLILQRCGEVWGGRLAKRLDQECSMLLGTRLGDLPLENFLRFIRDYFRFHGWGLLTIQVEQARESGIIEAELVDSIFTDIVDDAESMADPMLAGLLSSLIGYLSGQEIGCVQTECPTKGAASSKFILTSPTRLKYAEAEVKAGKKHQELLTTI